MKLTVPTTGHEFHFKFDGKHDAQAILTRKDAGAGPGPVAELSTEARQKIGLDVINIIENVLAKSNNLHFQTSDPYVAEFAKQYVDYLKTEKNLNINATINGPKPQQDGQTLAARVTTDFAKIKTDVGYDKVFNNLHWVSEHKENVAKLENHPKRSINQTKKFL